jgi:GNAT superfamily N-acetyltransferase
VIKTATVLAEGYAAVPPGHIAAVVTSLEMFDPPARPSGRALPPGFVLSPVTRADREVYRIVFRAVGADWLWFSRLGIADDALQALLSDPQIEVFALRQGEKAVGILELDFRRSGECELVYFGLIPRLVGQGIGRALMDEALRRAWSRPIRRFWVHTCSLDHPGAIDFYRRSGFQPYAFHVEVAPDPRLTGALPRYCGSHVPLVG